MNTESCERSIRQIREHLADVINDAVQGRITYVTSRGRRVAAVVPLTSISRAAGSSDVADPAVTP
jgi:prevent-host-death family protein